MQDYMTDVEDEPSEPMQKPPQDPAESEDAGEETALLNKSVLGGKHFEVGDEVVLRIVGMHDNEVEVQYAPEKPDEGGEEDSGYGPPPSDDMETMMS